MYEEVLKYGSMIVDALRLYNQPIFIYLPPHGELRGGAWVVVDPTINPSQMEMYAGKSSPQVKKILFRVIFFFFGLKIRTVVVECWKRRGRWRLSIERKIW
jgi:hypothetical protein